jgi:hypothetical protein
MEASKGTSLSKVSVWQKKHGEMMVVLQTLAGGKPSPYEYKVVCQLAQSTLYCYANHHVAHTVRKWQVDKVCAWADPLFLLPHLQRPGSAAFDVNIDHPCPDSKAAANFIRCSNFRYISRFCLHSSLA